MVFRMNKLFILILRLHNKIVHNTFRNMAIIHIPTTEMDERFVTLY
jgi:hypothetical protein